jgi:hypothetical protein
MNRANVTIGFRRAVWTASLVGLGALCILSSPVMGQPLPAMKDITEIYIPTEELGQITTHDTRGVLMPRREFADLLIKAHLHARQTPNVPDGIAVLSAAHQATIHDSQLAIRSTIEIEQVTDGWRFLRFAFRGLSIESALLDGQPAHISRGDDLCHTLHIFNDKKGRHTLRLELATAFATVGGDRVAAFGFGDLPLGRLDVAVTPKQFLLLNGSSLERPAAADKPAMYLLPIGGKDEIRLTVSGQTTEQPADRLIFADTAYRLRVSPGDAWWQAATSLDVFGNPIDRLTVAVPSGLKLTEVESTGMESWAVSEPAHAKPAILTLIWRSPFKGPRTIALKGILRPAAGPHWAVQSLKIAGATSQLARIQIEHPSDLRLKIESTHEVRAAETAIPRADVSENTLQRLSFDAWNEDFAINFDAEPKQRETFVNVLTAVDLTESGLELQLAANLQSLYGPLFETEITLPAEWTITTVTVFDKPIVWRELSAEAGTHHLVIPLDSPVPAGTKVPLIVTARREVSPWPVGEAGAEFTLPEVRFPSAGVLVGSYVIKGSEDFELTAVDVIGLDPAHLNLDRERIGYRYQDTRFSGKLKVARRPGRPTAETLIAARLDVAALRIRFQTTIESHGGGLRRLDLVLPAAIGKDVRFTADRADIGIIEQRVSEPVAGKRTWSLTFNRYVQGTIVLRAVAEIARGSAQEFVVPELKLDGVTLQSGYFVLQAGNDQELRMSAAGPNQTPLLEVDPVDLPSVSLIPDGRVVAAFRFVQPGNRVTIAETKLAATGIPQAICEQCELETLLAKSGNFQNRSNFRFVASGVQSLRVKLPEGGNLWAAVLDGKAAEVRFADDSYQIGFSGVANAASEQTLSIFYGTPQAKENQSSAVAVPLQTAFRVEQFPPQIFVVGRTGSAVPMEILQRTWRVVHPADLHPTKSQGSFEPKEPLRSASILGNLAENVGIGSTHRFWWQILYAAVTIAVVALFVTGYRRAEIRGLLGAACVVGLIAFTAIVLLQKESSRESAASKAQATALAETKWVPFGESKDFKKNENPAALGFGRFGAPVFSSKSKSITDNGAHGNQTGVPSRQRSKNVTSQQPLPESLQPQAPPPNAGAVPGFVAEAPNPASKTWGFAGGSRLSVPIDFDVPSGSEVHEFQFSGNDAASPKRARLDLAFASQMQDRTICLCVIMAVTYLFWLLCRSSIPLTRLVATLGITLPLGLVVVLPLAADVWLDGIFFGTLCGLILWFLRCEAIGASTGRSETNRQQRAAQSVMPSLIFVALLVSSPGIANAQIQVPLKAGSLQDRSLPSPAVSDQELSRSRIDVRRGRGTVIVPYDSSKDPLAAENVFLDRKTFLQLWNHAHPDQPLETRGPAPAVVAGAIYDAQLEGDPKTADSSRVVVTGRLVLESFVDRPATILLPFRQVALRGAKLDGEPASLIARRDEKDARNATTQYELVIAARGPHVLQVEFDLPARLTGPAGEFTVPLSPVAAGRLAFHLPAGAKQVRVIGASGGFRRSGESGQETIDVPIASAADLTIAWQPERDTAPGASSIDAEAATVLSIQDAGLRVHSTYLMHVSRENVSEFVFDLPPQLKLEQIRGAEVAGWKLEGDAKARRIVVSLRRKVGGATRIDLDLFQAVAISSSPTTIDAPLVAAHGVARETGTVALLVEPQFEVRTTLSGGLTQIDRNQVTLPPDWKPSVKRPEMAYRYVTRPLRLQWLVTRREAETHVAAIHAIVVGPRKATVSSRFRIKLSGTALHRAAVAVPKDFVPLAVEGVHVADWFVANATGDEKTIAIEFSSPQTGAFDLVLNGTVAESPADLKRTLRVPVLTNVRASHTELAVWTSDVYQATIDAADGWKAVPTEQVSPDLKSLVPTQPGFAFETDRVQPSTVALTLTRAVPRLSADSAAIITVTDRSIFYTLALQWTIAQAAADTFVVTTPDWLAGRLDFADPHAVNAANPRLREVTSAKLADGRIRWTLSLQDPVRDRFFLTATAVLAPPADGKVASPSLVFEGKEAAGEQSLLQLLTFQRQFVVLVNQSSAQLTPLNAGALEDIRKEDIPIHVEANLLAQALEIGRVARSGAAAEWRMDRALLQKGPPASVNLADLTTVVDASGSWRTLANYRIKNRARQFLALVLPPRSEILSVFVRDQASRPFVLKRGEKTLHLVPLPATSEADLAIDVRLILAGDLESGGLRGGWRVLSRTVELPVPQVVAIEAEPDYGIPVLRTQWALYFPKDTEVRALDEVSRTNLNTSNDAEVAVFDRSSILDEMKQLYSVLQLPSSGRANYRALENLRSLNQKLQEQRAPLQTGPASAAAVDLRKTEVELQGEIAKSQVRFQLDAGKQAAMATDKSEFGRDFNVATQSAQAKDLVAQNSVPIQQAPPGEESRADNEILGGRGEETFGFHLLSRAGETTATSDNSANRPSKAKVSISASRSQLRRQADQDQKLNDKLRRYEKTAPQITSNALSSGAPQAPLPPAVDFFTDNSVDAEKEGGADQAQAKLSRMQGSLSLPFDLPLTGRKLVFTKVGGDPKLTVSIRSRKSLDKGFALVWAVLWAAVAVAVASIFARNGQATSARRHLRWTTMALITMALGLAIFVLLPAPVSWLGLAILAIATTVEMLRRPRQTAAPRQT